MQGYKYTCEPGDVDWTPMNSNLHMQSIKVPPTFVVVIVVVVVVVVAAATAVACTFNSGHFLFYVAHNLITTAAIVILCLKTFCLSFD